MANNTVSINPAVPTISILKGTKGYVACSTKMRTLFGSQDSWTYVERGYVNEGVSTGFFNDFRKKDTKALFFI